MSSISRHRFRRLLVMAVSLAVASAAYGCSGSSASTTSSPASDSGTDAEAAPDGATVKVFCNVPSMSQCTITILSGNDESSGTVEVVTKTCTLNQGGTVSSCPTTALVGCCTPIEQSAPTVIEVCYYSDTAANQAQSCVNSAGTWSTTQ